MNKMILTLSILAMMVVSACAGQSPAPNQNEGQPAQCNFESVEKSYVGKSADECSRMKFMCIQGTEYFADECGCGCAPVETPSQDESYYFSIPKEECNIAAISCSVGMDAFIDEKGCGCKPAEQAPVQASGRTYISGDSEECKTLMFQCAEGRPFYDDTGCGCDTSAAENKLKATDCTPEQKQAEICTMEYLPVCGWFDSAKIQCIKYPCAQTFGNICQACAAENVVSWTQGECPQ